MAHSGSERKGQEPMPGTGAEGTWAFRARRGLVGLWAGTWGICPACWSRRRALHSHSGGAANGLWVRGRREAGDGFWMGCQVCPWPASEAPLVSAAPSALIQPQGKSPLRNASEAQPGAPTSLPQPLGTRDGTLLLCPLPASWGHPPPSKAGTLRAGNSSGSLTYFLRGKKWPYPVLGSSSGYLSMRCLHGESGGRGQKCLVSL